VGALAVRLLVGFCRWSASALLCGVGIGVAAGGGLLEHFGSPAVLATGSAAALVAAAAAAFIRRD